MTTSEMAPGVIPGLGYMGAPSSVDSFRANFESYALNYQPWLPGNRDASILDFGCGFGNFISYLTEFGYRNLFAFDVNPRCDQFIRQHFKCRTEVSQDALTFLKSQSNSHDSIMIRQAAYYFPRNDLQKWFDAVAGALRPNGRLIVEVVNAASFSGMWPYHNDPGIQFVFGEEMLKTLVERAGLQIEYLGNSRVPSKGIKRALWQLGQAVLARALRCIYVLERGNDPRNPTFFGKNLLLVARNRSEAG